VLNSIKLVSNVCRCQVTFLSVSMVIFQLHLD